MQAEDIAGSATRVSTLFAALVSSLTEQNEDISRLQESSDRFALWAGNIGAYHSGRNTRSLGHRLRGVPKLKNRFLRILEDLEEDLQDLGTLISEIHVSQLDTPEPNQIKNEADVQSLLEAISVSISALFKASSIARRATARDQYSLALQRINESDVEPQSVDLEIMTDICSRLRYPSLVWLRERLALANNHRRRYLKYREQHQSGISTGRSDVLQARPIRGSTSEDISDNHTERSSVYDKSAATTVVAAKLETIEFEVDDAASQASFMSYATKYADSLRFAVLDLAEVRKSQGSSDERPEMVCRYCKNEVAPESTKVWEKHVMADLKAYCCTWPECGLQLFTSKRTWLQHELSEHFTRWACGYCTDDHLFTTRSDYDDHMRRDHASRFKESQLDQLATVSSHVVAHLPTTSCRFCNWSERRRLSGKAASDYVSPKQYRDHVASHMEQIALAILPEHEVRLDIHDDAGHDSGSEQSTAETRPDERHSDTDIIQHNTDELEDERQKRDLQTVGGNHAKSHNPAWVTPADLRQHNVALDNSEVGELVDEIREHFMVLYQSGPLPEAIGDAPKRFETWTETMQLGRASSAQAVQIPAQAKAFLTRLQIFMEDYGAAQNDEDRQESTRGILKQLQNLEQLQTPAVHTDPNIREKEILQARSVKHQYIRNNISDQASVHKGDQKITLQHRMLKKGGRSRNNLETAPESGAIEDPGGPSTKASLFHSTSSRA